MATMHQSSRQISAMSCLELRAYKATVTGTGNDESLLSLPEDSLYKERLLQEIAVPTKTPQTLTRCLSDAC